MTQNDGVVIYVNRNLVYTVMEPQILDANCLLLKLNNDVAILGIYRSPSHRDLSNFLHSLDSILFQLKDFKNIILAGDININIGNNNFSDSKNNYLSLIARHDLVPAHVLPTRLGNCLDHILLKSNHWASTFVTHSPLTDHNAVLSFLGCKYPKMKEIRKITKINYAGIDAELKQEKFDRIFKVGNANEAADLFVHSLMHIIQSHSSICVIANRKAILKPWITPGLLRCMRHRDRLHKKVNKKPNDEVLKLSYLRYRNFCNNLLRKIKNEYEKNELNKSRNSNRHLWKTINKISNRAKPKESPCSLITKDQTVDDINSFFANIGKSLAQQNFSNALTHTDSVPIGPSPLHSFASLPTDDREVAALISSLKVNCAVGWDSISNQFLKSYSHLLTPPMTHICNLSLSTGVFPTVFKKAIVQPIHKSGDKGCVNNYRPISLLSALSKVLERLINGRLVDFLEKNNILSSRQFGFRKGKSTSDAVHEMTDYVVDNLDFGRKVIGIFLDLAKAFDTVSVPLLIKKLELIGIRGNQLALFVDYLTSRTQCVRIGSQMSRELRVDYGVPQGSILGPTLFLIYINDLCNIDLTGGRMIAFADDTVLLFSAESCGKVCSVAQSGFNIVNKWLRNNILTLNADKTKYIFFTLSHTPKPSLPPPIKVHTCDPYMANCFCPVLERVESIKYLGIIIDSKLTFQPYIDVLSDRLRKLIYVFKTLRNVADAKILTSVYFALCQSLIRYCITSWGGMHKNSLLKLERTQRCILKVMYNLPYRFPTRDLYQKAKVLTVRQLYILCTVLKQHTRYPYNPLRLTGKRRKDMVFSNARVYQCSFTHHFFCFQGSVLYNKISKLISIYHLNKKACKDAVENLLMGLSYDRTEELLSFK